MKSNEWYTPAKYIEAARSVMGGIDLDPASCELANQTVRATTYYTKEQNGLMLPWHGRVWLNPPFSNEDTPKGPKGAQKGFSIHFVNKLIRVYQDRDIEQAILLVNAKHDARWFRRLWSFPICFADHKVHFLRPKVGFESQMFGTCFVYLGSHLDLFLEHFSPFGPIVKAITQPKLRPLNLELFTEDAHV